MWRRLWAVEGKEMLFCLFVFLLLTIHSCCQPCGQSGTELELTQAEKMLGLLKGSLLWSSVLPTNRSAVKLSLDGCSSCSLKYSLFCILNWPVEIVLLAQKNKLSRKRFYSVFYEELELGKAAAAVPCAFNTSLSQNRELHVSITWLHSAHIFSSLS